MRKLFRAISAVLILLAIALVSALITMRLAIHGTEVRVPVLPGLTVPQAAARLHALGLETGIEGRFYSTTQPIGHVLTQSPAPGTQVRKSWRVRISVSLGPQKVAIPALQGMDQNIAAITVHRIGLQLGDIAAIPYAYAPENSVIAQTPQANAKGVQGPRIGLLTAEPAPPPDNSSVMPDLTGEDFTAAALTILHAGFTLAPLQNPGETATDQSTSTATPTPSGTVIAQAPSVGSRIAAGSTIQLTVQP